MAQGKSRGGEGGLPEGVGSDGCQGRLPAQSSRPSSTSSASTAGQRRRRRREQQVRRPPRRCSSRRRWPGARAAALEPVRSRSSRAQGAASRSSRRSTAAPGLEARASAASSFRLVAGGQRRCRHPGLERRQRQSPFEAASGRSIWRANVGAKLLWPASAATARSRRWSTRGGDLVALGSRPGQRGRRRSALGSPTAPLVAGGRDLRASASTARCRPSTPPTAPSCWQVQRPGDPPTLAQAGRRSPRSRTRWSLGQAAHGRHRPDTPSTIRWEVPVGSPRGANEVERLADLDRPGAAHRRPCSAPASFQAAVGCCRCRCAAASCGPRQIGGTDAVAGDSERLFGADASGPHHHAEDAERRRGPDVGGA